MVGITRTLLGMRRRSEKVLRYDQSWVDRVRIYARGGSGGNGVPRIGGIGGRGGDVIIKSSPNVKDLKRVVKMLPTKRAIAGDGGHSRQVRLLGETGSDIVVEVPLGVTVTTDEGKLLGDLLKKGDTVTAVKGGVGGCEGTNFLGSPGEKLSVRLDLKLLGDVGFVGFPNAGKSTLLKALSRAKPKIASYPFTTIKPNLGVCQMEDLRTISFADLPGLIEGAHQNLGMGHSFLKHVERTRVLMFVVDINGFQFKPASPLRSALETILILNKELELYKEELLDKPALCVLTKMDSTGAEKKYELLKENLDNINEIIQDENIIDPEFRPNRLINFSDFVPVSAKFSPKTVEYLKFRVRDVIDASERINNEELMLELTEKIDLKLNEKTRLV